MRNKFYILIDYRNQFYSSTKYRGASMNFLKIKTILEKNGYIVIIRNFSEINFSKNYNDSFIIYQSSEDPELKYKDFIEDIILGLKLKGAILIPKFEYFRAHHNKVFMEVLRDISNLENIKNIKTQKFGTYEELQKYNNSQYKIIKISSGSKSNNVFLLNLKKLKKKLHQLNIFNLKLKIKSFFDKKPFTPISNFRNKFITQNYIKNLDGDYKILIYGDKYYVLYRKNRKNDFRASGSGFLEFVEKPNEKLLNFAEKIKKYFNNPILSLDIAFNGKEYFLIEFQFLMFGNHTLEKSNFYFEKQNNQWEKINKKSDLEEEFSNAILDYISDLD